MEMMAEILDRRSIRKFKPDPVEKEKLERVLEAGRLAPSAKNRQEWRFVVLQKKEIREKIKDAAFGSESMGQAPVIIVLCTTNIDYRMPNGQLSYPIDLSFAASFMLLQAVSEGLGTCCVSTFDEQAVRDALSVPYGMRVVLLLLIGYPDEKPEPGLRKPLKSIVSYNHW
ncbi:NADH dehydrogenase [subsurface metagenome]